MTNQNPSTNRSGPVRKVCILHNEPILPSDHPDAESEHEIRYTSGEVYKYLSEAGHEVDLLPVGRNPTTLIEGIRKLKPDVVFNLFEGLADLYESEAYVAGMLEYMGIPYTGSPFKTLVLARDKAQTKRVLIGAGLPTARFIEINSSTIPHCDLTFPVIVKPGAQDASVGVDQGSVVQDQAGFETRVRYLLERYGAPVLAEELLTGREFSMALIEKPDLTPMPISEITFQKPSGHDSWWPIVTYDAKWRPGTVDYDQSPTEFPAKVTPELKALLEATAMKAFRLMGCRDYGRVDIRLHADGRPCILEINPNPDFSPLAGCATAMEEGGVGHAWFSNHLIERAYRRKQDVAPLKIHEPPMTPVAPIINPEAAAKFEGLGF
jgi:D-alanine-D-alanine ligase